MEAPAELQIELQAPTEPKVAQRRADPADSAALRVCPLGRPSAEPRLYLRYACMKQALAHANGETSVEVGGVLVGETYMTRRGQVVELAAALPASTLQAGMGHVTFSHDAWNEIYRKLDAMEPGLRILGWYHSHPGFGVFLSPQDRFIQSGFFADPANVAMVLDPLFRRVGLFGWRGGDLVSLSGAGVLADEVQTAAAERMLSGLSYDAAGSAEGIASQLWGRLRRRPR
jgi:proteasome lid subunit RPN8/RPN11